MNRRRRKREPLWWGLSPKPTRYDWLFDPGNMSQERFERFEQLVARDLKTAKAWQHRILFTEFWECPSEEQALEFFHRWYRRAVRSRLAEVIRAAKTLKHDLDGLINYIKNRITNALSESFNSRVQSLKASAKGVHHFKSFRTRILFFLGALDLQPR